MNYRRSSSFNLLPRNSPGDGDRDLLTSKAIAPGTHNKKRRKNKNKKNLAGIPSALLATDLQIDEGDGARSTVSTPGGLSTSDQQNPFSDERFNNFDRCLDGSTVSRSQSLPSTAFLHGDHDELQCTKSIEIPSNGNHIPVYSSACSVNAIVDEVSPVFTTNGKSYVEDDSVKKNAYQMTSSALIQGWTQNDRIDTNPTLHMDSSTLIQDLNVVSSSSKNTLEETDASKDTFISSQSDRSDQLTKRELRQRIIAIESSDYLNSKLEEQKDDIESSRQFLLATESSGYSNSNVEEEKAKIVSSWSDQLPRTELRQRVLAKESSDYSNNNVEEDYRDMRDNQNQASSISSSGASISYQTPQKLVRVPVHHAETPQLVDWQQLMSDNSSCPEQAIGSPFDYFVGEVLRTQSNSQETQSVETDKKRQHVYNTMFHVPWRCELLIIVGFFVCLDSFLSLMTVMPVRVVVLLWRLIANRRQFRRLRADELADLGSLLVLVAGVTLLQQTDISYIYHMIRSQATIKLYVVYNVLEIFDKLCQSFGSDVLQVLLNSAENVATCSSVNLLSETLRFALDQCIAVVSFVVHSYIILAQSITVSAAIRSHNNALLTLLISNNFAEIKSNVFKRLGKDNLHKLAYLDTVERFHIIAHLFFVLAQNLLAANEPWLVAFAWNAGMVFLCEILVDIIKHAFLAKFNEIKPAAYSEFLLSLCQQTLSSQSHEVHKTLSFVPFAPACVVIRVLIPLYAAYLPLGFMSRLLVILLYGILTYLFLVGLKILVAFGLLKHASWYVARYRKKEKLLHFD